ncbi:MAG TPA: homoserine dehydrogenase, partial [Ferruginibacter sp.]|nr:homoserine dehydrogenase [Ferruginibacter sp.]
MYPRLNKMKTQLALFGFGVVGEGVYQLCEQHPELQLRVKAIAVKHKNKKRKAPTSLFVKNNDVQLQDDSIDLFIEVIDDEAESYRIVKTLLLTGKKVISANKKMLAHHLTELRTLEKTHGGCLLYEAAVCASIPVIRTLDTSFNPQLLSGLEGILNGSCNYILTRMHQQSCSFETALKEAQQEGFAESDPHLDISGTDSINKLCILIRHAFGLSATPDELFFKGIESIPLSTIQWAQSKGYCIKLLARAQQSENGIIATVLPTLVQNNATLAAVHHEWNGLIISSKGNDCQFLCGKGAGRLPTALAILHDALGIENGYHYTDRSNEVSLG